MPPPTGTRIRREDAGAGFERATNAVHRFIFGRFRARRLEVEDAHFNTDSAVLLPDAVGADPDDLNQVTGLGVLRTVWLHAQRHEDDRLLVAGHTDRSGSADHNLALSRRRGRNLLHLLLGERDEWATLSAQHHKDEDVQQILIWVDQTFGFGCDPGPVTGSINERTRTALRTFKTRYNADFDPDIPVNGTVGPDTWRAFFDVYHKELLRMLQTDEAGLASLRAGLRFVSDERRSVGCGENHPVTSAHKSRVDRRVELLFFAAAELPLLDCHPSATGCVPGRCEIYPPGKVFDVDPIPVDDFTILAVHLRLRWQDPLGLPHDFPAGFPVTVQPGNGGAAIEAQVGDGGVLRFSMDRRLDSFTLAFRTENAAYVVSPPGGESGDEALAFDPELPDIIAARKRFWKLPAAWSLTESEWSGPTGGDTSTAPFANHRFTGLANAARTVGRRSTPVQLLLDPHWQFVRLVYFDRFLRRRISVPRTVVEGFITAAGGDSAGTPPDTVSNWTTNTDEAARQCLPWVIQRSAAGAATARPNGQGMLRYRTAPRTFIESSAPNARRLVTVAAGSGGGGTADPFVNRGADDSFDPDRPNADRVRFYDLPAVWKSRGYFARLTNDAGPGPVADGFYAALATQPTSDERPLSFSLDDLILYQGNQSGQLGDPLPWNGATDRVALFSNDFGTGTAAPANAFEALGLFRPDTAGGRPWFSERVTDTANQNYIADHPDWVRLAVSGGSLFDVFDQRTPDQAGRVVGARAGVRWVDLTPAGQGVAVGATKVARAPVTVRFFTVQAVFDTIGPYASPDRLFPDNTFGRFDIALLRCCGIDGTTELAVNLHFFRFAFSFTTQAVNDDGTPNTGHTAPANLTPAVAAQFETDAIGNTLARWNGGDGRGGGVDAVPASGSLFRIMVRWFAQSLPNAVAHFLLRVYLPDTRAFMGSFRGDGEMGLEDNPGPWAALPGAPTHPLISAVPGPRMVIAHEAGHGNGLTDEYTESARTATYLAAPGLFSFSPGSPYDADGNGMMTTNRNVRARNFWHAAEWMRRQLPGTPRLAIRQRLNASVTYQYQLPSHATVGRHFTTEPWHQVPGATRGTRGRFDAFLYPLSQDFYSHRVLAGGHFGAGPPADSFDGLLMVVVKLKVTFHSSRELVVTNGLQQITRTIETAFNDTWMVRGQARGRRFERCLLVFSPRFLVTNYPDHASDAAFRTRYHGGMGITNKRGLDRRVSDIVSTHGFHFDVTTRASGASAWRDTFLGNLTGNNDDLDLMVPGTPTPVPGLEEIFGNMLGIDSTPTNVEANIAGVAAVVFPGLTAADVTRL